MSIPSTKRVIRVLGPNIPMDLYGMKCLKGGISKFCLKVKVLFDLAFDAQEKGSNTAEKHVFSEKLCSGHRKIYQFAVRLIMLPESPKINISVIKKKKSSLTASLNALVRVVPGGSE